MAWIQVIEEQEAKGELKELYDDVQKKRGKVANIIKIHSLNPRSMKVHMDLYMEVMFGRSGISRSRREMIATVVSSANHCDYCVKHHGEALNFYWKDYARVDQLANDHSLVSLDEQEIRMLNYAVKLTNNPEAITQSDIEDLRKSGFSDDEILSINLITAYFNFVNRIALGLGVDLTAEEMKGYKY